MQTTTARTSVRTPVKAVPEKIQAKGSKYQGAAAMHARLNPKATIEVATAPHARHGFMSKTCKGR